MHTPRRRHRRRYRQQRDGAARGAPRTRRAHRPHRRRRHDAAARCCGGGPRRVIGVLIVRGGRARTRTRATCAPRAATARGGGVACGPRNLRRCRRRRWARAIPTPSGSHYSSAIDRRAQLLAKQWRRAPPYCGDAGGAAVPVRPLRRRARSQPKRPQRKDGSAPLHALCAAGGAVARHRRGSRWLQHGGQLEATDARGDRNLARAVAHGRTAPRPRPRRRRRRDAQRAGQGGRHAARPAGRRALRIGDSAAAAHFASVAAAARARLLRATGRRARRRRREGTADDGRRAVRRPLSAAARRPRRRHPPPRNRWRAAEAAAERWPEGGAPRRRHRPRRRRAAPRRSLDGGEEAAAPWARRRRWRRRTRRRRRAATSRARPTRQQRARAARGGGALAALAAGRRGCARARRYLGNVTQRRHEGRHCGARGTLAVLARGAARSPGLASRDSSRLRRLLDCPRVGRRGAAEDNAEQTMRERGARRPARPGRQDLWTSGSRPAAAGCPPATTSRRLVEVVGEQRG